MNDVDTLHFLLLGKPLGTITRLPDDRNIFTFHQSYIDDSERFTLSLSFKDIYGRIITDIPPTRTRLPPFFSNLLPEGLLREYLAKHAQVNPTREFFLLKVLSDDLPGALTIEPSHNQRDLGFIKRGSLKEKIQTFHFSLAGVQLKFSAFLEDHDRLTIPTSGSGGGWIVKLPSLSFEGVPENEFCMMELARQVKINVPKTALIPLKNVHGLPEDLELKGHCFIINRFDRSDDNKRVHIEDFAQVFGVYPEKKYQAVSYRNLAEVIYIETGEKGLEEFVRRFIFNALIGNGDMHIKNWSLIYPEGRHPALSPAYDFVSTLPYIPNEGFALTFYHSKAFSCLTVDNLRRFCFKGNLPARLVLKITEETIELFHEAWKKVDDLPIDKDLKRQINEHLKKLPLLSEVKKI